MTNISTASIDPVHGTGKSADTIKQAYADPSSPCTPRPRTPIAQGLKRSHSPERNEPLIAAKRKCARPGNMGMRLFTRGVKFALPLAPSKTERMVPGPAVDEATKTALEQCVDLALKLLEEGRGNRVLISVGNQIVTERREAARTGITRQPEAGIYTDDVRNMPIWVARFLRQVRQLGIPICVCDTIPGYGLTQRWAWGTDMADYDCRNSAVVYIHQRVSIIPKSLRLCDAYLNASWCVVY